jgi:putative N6-adenine-specific DNA methylase
MGASRFNQAVRRSGLRAVSVFSDSMFDYQERHDYFAQTPGGMEDLAAIELSELGAVNVRPGYRGLHFEADEGTLYRVNYEARVLARVLAPLKSFHCHNTAYLYRQAKSMDWSSLFSPDQTFAVSATVSHSRIRHSRYAALCLKDAVVDYFREHEQRRPNIRRIEPDVRINLHIENNLAVISFDTSGGSLHRRGYRLQTVEAPMQELLAASVVRLMEWDGSRRLYDPLCGSGTLLAEALMSFCRIPAGFLRKHFGFEYLPDFDKSLWIKVRRHADSQIMSLPEGLIAGSDLSAEAVKAAKANLKTLPHGEGVLLNTMDFRHIPSLEDAMIVCNPPYGIRLNQHDNIQAIYKRLGDFLKQKCKGSSAFVYLGARTLIPYIGLKPSWKRALSAGGLDGRLVKFEIY